MEAARSTFFKGNGILQRHHRRCLLCVYDKKQTEEIGWVVLDLMAGLFMDVFLCFIIGVELGFPYPKPYSILLVPFQLDS